MALELGISHKAIGNWRKVRELPPNNYEADLHKPLVGEELALMKRRLRGMFDG